jgi:glycosyltransferase involved in cell wall biosynthesis
MKQQKIAIVCDWLTNKGGAERVVMALHKVYPDAPIYTSVFDITAFPELEGVDVRTTWLQKLPHFLRYKHQLFPVFRAFAFPHLDLSEYDVIISSASAEAKAVRKRPDAQHICYCHTPTRYYWSHYDQYMKDPGLGILNPLVRLVMPGFVRWMRRLDLKAAAGVDYFIANSVAVAERIKKYYQRDATVVYPPVALARFKDIDINQPRQGYITIGRQVPYKRHDLIVEACTRRGIELTIYGNGPEHDKLVRLAGPTVTFVTDASDEDIVKGIAGAKGFLYAAEEDLGIVMIEALAGGTPVIAYGRGGAADIVTPYTGVLFDEQTAKSIESAIFIVENMQFNPSAIAARAADFSEEVFTAKIRETVKKTSK